MTRRSAARSSCLSVRWSEMPVIAIGRQNMIIKHGRAMAAVGGEAGDLLRRSGIRTKQTTLDDIQRRAYDQWDEESGHSDGDKHAANGGQCLFRTRPAK